MGSKIGLFEPHSELPQLVEFIEKQWTEEKCVVEEAAEEAFGQIDGMFAGWEGLRVEDVAMDKGEKEKEKGENNKGEKKSE